MIENKEYVSFLAKSKNDNGETWIINGKREKVTKNYRETYCFPEYGYCGKTWYFHIITKDKGLKGVGHYVLYSIEEVTKFLKVRHPEGFKKIDL